MDDPSSVSVGELARTAVVAGGVLIVALILFYGLDIAGGSSLFFTHDLGFSDIWHLNYPLKHFYQQELAEGRLPLWCPLLGTGFPLHAEGQVGALSPLNLVLYSALQLPLAFNWSILLHALLAGVFASAFARRVGAGRGGSVLAGLVFALSGFFIVHLKHLNMTEAAAWIPLLLLLLELHFTERRARYLVLMSVAVAAMILAGHPQIAYNNLLVAGAYALYLQVRLWRRPSPAGRGRDSLRFGGGLGLALCAGLLLAAPQILPTLELHGLGTRQSGLTIDEATEYPFRPAHLLLFVAPRAFGDPGELRPVPHARRNSGEPILHPRTGEPLQRLQGFVSGPGRPTLFGNVTGYVGLLPLGLALVAAILGFSRSRVRALLGGLGLSLLLTLGKSGGLFWLLWYLPGFRLFRFHGRFLLYVDLFLAVLAGIGLTLLLDRLGGNRRRAGGFAAAAAALVICYLDVHHALGDHNPKIAVDRWTSPPPSVQRIREEEAGSRAPFRILGNDAERFVFQNAYYRARGWKGDLSPYDPARNMLDPNLNLLFDVANLRSYFQVVPRWMRELSSVLYLPVDESKRRSAGVSPRILGLFNVKYVLDPHGDLVGKLPVIEEFPGDVWLAGPVLLERPPYTIRLHRSAALPRAYLVPLARTVYDTAGPGGDLAEPVRELVGAQFDPLAEVLIVRQPGEPAVEGGRAGPPIRAPVEFVEYGSRRIRLRVEALRDCWLVLSDTWYPGWSASVDGDEVTVHRANVAGRAVRVPAGVHEVVFRFASRSLRWGWVLAVLGLAVLGALAFLRRPCTGSA